MSFLLGAAAIVFLLITLDFWLPLLLRVTVVVLFIAIPLALGGSLALWLPR